MNDHPESDTIDIIALGDFLEERIAAWESDMRDGKRGTSPLADHLASCLLAVESPIANVMTTVREDIEYISRIEGELAEVRSSTRRAAIKEAMGVVAESRAQLVELLSESDLSPVEIADGHEAVNMLSRVEGAIGKLYKSTPPFMRGKKGAVE